MTEESRVPADRRYTKDHEWVRIDGQTAVVGITDHAQSAMGDITYVELPKIGTNRAQAQPLAVVESTKAASDVFAPVSGTVSEINTLLEDSPETLNTSPYEEGWICKLSGIVEADIDSLLSPIDYESLIRLEA